MKKDCLDTHFSYENMEKRKNILQQFPFVVGSLFVWPSAGPTRYDTNQTVLPHPSEWPINTFNKLYAPKSHTSPVPNRILKAFDCPELELVIMPLPGKLNTSQQHPFRGIILGQPKVPRGGGGGGREGNYTI